jgi:tetratricopeptide (TPR) repeat protein
MATTQEKLVAGWNLIQAGDLPRAREHFLALSEAEPLFVQAWYLLGSVNQVMGNVTESLANYERALRLDPNHVPALNNLGVALQSVGMPREAAASLRIAIRNNPDYAEAHNNLGNSLKDQGDLDGAVASYRRAIAINLKYFDAYNNLGNALRAQGHLAESMCCYETALELQPGNPQMHLNRALVWLQMGDFARGWPEYEWRLKCNEYAIPAVPHPRWDGSCLLGRKILLYADHGLGDTLQFIRYAPLVEERGGCVILKCQKAIAGLLASCPGVEQVVVEDSPLPEFAVYSPLMSLPMIFGTTLESVPDRVPYLAPAAERVSRWRDELGPPGAFKIGISWQGNPRHRRDRERSFRLAKLEPIAKISGVELVGLQGIFGLEQLSEVENRFVVRNLGERLTDFMDIAAVMRSLDLVIAPDTALAHLAGAVGVPVWVALSRAPDWRWLDERTDSPWYPSMRLFRQKRWGDWDLVFERMAAELSPLVETRKDRAG